MNQASPSAFLLFELLARRWAVPSPAIGLMFNSAQGRLAAPLADGSIALVDCADREPPEGRIAADESGRKTIAPRRSDPPPATIASAQGPGPAAVRRDSDDGFLVAYRDASLWRLQAEGSVAAIAPTTGASWIAFDRCAATGVTLIATAAETVLRSDSGTALRVATPAGLCSAALSPDGAMLALGRGDSLALAPASAPSAISQCFPAPGGVGQIVWREDSAFLAAACDNGELALLDVGARRFGCLGGFRAPPRSIAWSGPANALVVSGAYRIAAWTLDRPPFDGDHSGALETGRTGRMTVDAVAAHPARKVVAAAYSNGQIVVAEIGRRDELQLKTSGPTVTALAWSDDGRMLAIADQASVALVSLPDLLFK